MKEDIAYKAPELTFISRDELQAVVGGLVDVKEHVLDGELPQGDISANAVALWAMQQAYTAVVGPRPELEAERRDLELLDYDRVLRDETWQAVHNLLDRQLSIVVHEDCVYPEGGTPPEWVAEWHADTQRWWRRPRLAAELVAYAPKMKADLEACIEGDGLRSGRDISAERPSREHGPVERRARQLVHVYLVDVVALIESRLRSTKAAAV